jgi:hypothetical protein
MRVWVVGLQSGSCGVILHSADGGANWRRQIYTPQPGVNGNLLHVHGNPPHTVWVVGNGTVMRSTNDGATWKNMTPLGESALFDYNGVYAVNANTVWVTRDQGGIFLFNGFKWRQQPSGYGGYEIMRISALDGQTAWTVGAATLPGTPPGVILFKQKGQAWTPQSFAPEVQLVDVSFPRNQRWSPPRNPYLVFSTYLGGTTPFDPTCSPLTFAQNTACDAQGNIYVTGATQVSDLPVLNASQPTPAPGSKMSAFVAKYNAAGQRLWCSYLGGNNQSIGVGVAAMPDGGVAVAGLTTSVAPHPFPVLDAFQEHNHGESDYFVTVFDADGNIRYSTYLGGSGVEGTPGSVFADDSNNGNNVATDANGLVYVTGTTSSGGSGAHKFPVTANALQSDLNGAANSFLCIINPSEKGLDSLVYSSFLGGDKNNKGHSVAVDARGRYITVAGYTDSRNFPTTANAYRSHPPPHGFTSNGFVSQFLSSQPGALSSQYTMNYSTYLGADTNDARDDAYGMVMDAKGLIVATGRTQSAGFPMTRCPPIYNYTHHLHSPLVGLPMTRCRSIYNRAPYLKSGTSADEPYLVKINPSLPGKASLVYSTFLGGGSPDKQWGGFCTSVGVDARGRVYVGGESNAQGVGYIPSWFPAIAPTRFPYTPNALFKALQGDFDAIFMQIAPGGIFLGYSSFLGGNRADRTYGLAVDPSGNVVLSGLTFSDNFPLENPAQTWPHNTGSQNAFVAKFYLATCGPQGIAPP